MRHETVTIPRQTLKQGHWAAGLACVHPRPYKATTVQDKANATGLVDLVGRSFVPARKNELWYGDITYIFTMSGWAYLGDYSLTLLPDVF